MARLVHLILACGSAVAGAQAPAEPALNEIVVTAQRRAQPLQEVPISVAAFGSEEVERMGITDLDRLGSLTPSVNFQSYSSVSYSNVLIRGVGSHLNDQGFEQGVAVYVDDVFIGTHQAYNFGLLDVDRIEVLRGPQGTLYGKNAMGGAIRIFSATPGAERMLRFDGAYGNDGLYRARATANLPASDTLKFRVSLGGAGHDPYLRNTAGPGLQDQDQKSARIQMAYQPSDRIDFNLNVDWTQDDQKGLGVGLFDTVSDRVVALDGNFFEERDLFGGVATLNYRADGFTVTSVTGYRKLDLAFGSDGDNLPVSWMNSTSSHEFHQLSEEIRLASAGEGAFSWVTGAYFYKDESNPVNGVELRDIAPVYGLPVGYSETSVASVDTRTLAAFADATYALNDVVSLTAGLRYTDEKKDADYSHTNSIGIPGVFAPAQLRSGSDSFDELSPRFVLTTQWTKDFMTYASASRGVKGGGFTVLFLGAEEPLSFGPEKAWNYEIGAKTTWLDRRLTVNLAAFYFDWEDQQVQAIIQNPTGPGILLSTDNAAQSVSKGVDFELVALPASWLQLSLGYSYNDAHFVSYPDAPAGDFSGNRLPITSRNSANASFTVRRALTPQLDFVMNGSYNYKSDLFFDTANTQQQDAYELVNARLGVETDRWGVHLFGNNLTDEAYRTAAFPNFLEQLTATVNDPRTYGIEFSIKLQP